MGSKRGNRMWDPEEVKHFELLMKVARYFNVPTESHNPERFPILSEHGNLTFAFKRDYAGLLPTTEGFKLLTTVIQTAPVMTLFAGVSSHVYFHIREYMDKQNSGKTFLKFLGLTHSMKKNDGEREKDIYGGEGTNAALSHFYGQDLMNSARLGMVVNLNLKDYMQVMVNLYRMLLVWIDDARMPSRTREVWIEEWEKRMKKAKEIWGYHMRRIGENMVMFAEVLGGNDSEELVTLAGSEKRGQAAMFAENETFQQSLARCHLARNAIGFGENNMQNTLVVIHTLPDGTKLMSVVACDLNFYGKEWVGVIRKRRIHEIGIAYGRMSWPKYTRDAFKTGMEEAYSSQPGREELTEYITNLNAKATIVHPKEAFMAYFYNCDSQSESLYERYVELQKANKILRDYSDAGRIKTTTDMVDWLETYIPRCDENMPLIVPKKKTGKLKEAIKNLDTHRNVLSLSRTGEAICRQRRCE